MTKVTVKARSNARVFRVSIDNVRLRFVNGRASKNLAAGRHVLSWVVAGNQGDTYSVRITSPASVQCSGSSQPGGLGPQQFDFGACRFTVT